MNKTYIVSNVSLGDEKITLFHQYLRNSHKCCITGFKIPIGPGIFRVKKWSIPCYFLAFSAEHGISALFHDIL